MGAAESVDVGAIRAKNPAINATEVITTVRGTYGNNALARVTNIDAFEASTGNDVLQDFTASVDYVDLSVFGSLRASDVTASMVSGNLRLSFDGNTITFEGATKLDAAANSLGVAAFETPTTIAAATFLATTSTRTAIQVDGGFPGRDTARLS